MEQTDAFDKVVAAVVLHFRSPAQTLDCLNSLASEGLSNVVLVDNSEDGGASIAAMGEGLAELARSGLGAHVLDGKRNLGFAAGVNLALAHLLLQDIHEVLLINSDAGLQEGCLGKLRAGLDAGADVVAPMIQDGNGRTHSPVSYYQIDSGLITQRWLPGSVAYLTGACLLLGPRAIRQRLLDEDFFFYGEDVMLAADLRARSLGSEVVSDATVLHHGAGSARNGSLFYEYHMNRAHLLLATKLPLNGVQRMSALLGRAVVLPTRALIRTMKSRTVVPWRALVWACNDLLRDRYRTLTPPLV